ncbi:hypothetical protein SPLC1_S510330 [Arthrospira platensis C1]|uniref:Uncharacterized protein n=2 Tax=Limnospira TaxID=2596745 RepID=A0A9P1P1C9_9CYAN|nr:hypothetical protein AmaxDRAFT_1561 [Limnospira maxima CS-328]EKD06920.1 hypothetical protein SPLC1_S510330 [Arthrospira platensis C1]CDM95759.1 conserved protein of unknown function [Limnospira indica PCC 8005]
MLAYFGHIQSTILAQMETPQELDTGGTPKYTSYAIISSQT